MKSKRFFILIFLLFIIILIITYINEINSIDSMHISNEISVKNNLLSTRGDPITINEYANRTDSIFNLLITYNYTTKLTNIGQAGVPLPPSWTPYLLIGNIYNLKEKRDWITDSGFEYPNNWSLYTFHNKTGDSWYIGFNGTGLDDSSCIYMKMDSETVSGETSYNKLDSIYVSQNLTNINRDDISEAYLSFDYKVNAYSWDLSSLGFNIFVAVNSTRPQNPNKTYSYWTTDWSGNPLVSNDDIAIWSTGDTLTDILSLEEQTEIGNYLDNGGKV
ncbi:MAG: hypothetical protein ACTSYZ_14460, partial [Candidatus Helarchaeota archaeon]